jgi:hypothetical protein
VSDETEDIVDDILEQLKNSKKECTHISKIRDGDEPEINRDDLESFVIRKSASLVQKALDIVDEIRDQATAASDSESLKALADMVKATSSAVDALNKVHIASERNKTAKEISKAQIDARTGMNTQNNQTRLMLSREEVMNRLFGSAKENNEQKNNNKLPETYEVDTEVLSD